MSLRCDEKSNAREIEKTGDEQKQDASMNETEQRIKEATASLDDLIDQRTRKMTDKGLMYHVEIKIKNFTSKKMN